MVVFTGPDYLLVLFDKDIYGLLANSVIKRFLNMYKTKMVKLLLRKLFFMINVLQSIMPYALHLFIWMFFF